MTVRSETVECPRLHARLLLQCCIDRHLGRSESLDSEAKEVCARCPLGAQRATVAGIRLQPEGGAAEQPKRGCCNPECRRPSRPDSRYCSKACKMAVDRTRAKICYARKQGLLRQAEVLQHSLDEVAVQRGWPAVRRLSTPDKVHGEIEALFGEPLVLDGQRLWTSGQVWQGLGYGGRYQLLNLLGRSWQRDIVDGEDTWVLSRSALDDVRKSKVDIKSITTSQRFVPYTRVFTEVGLWKLALLARTEEALRFRGRVFEALRTLRAYWQQEV